jgi:hypothetical protein
MNILKGEKVSAVASGVLVMGVGVVLGMVIMVILRLVF